MIPYFGPFLGGIPSILLLCIYSLNSALIFAILIIIIQQLDGNLIGPKILGNDEIKNKLNNTNTGYNNSSS